MSAYGLPDTGSKVIATGKSGIVSARVLARDDMQVLIGRVDEKTVYYVVHDKKSAIDNMAFNFLFVAETP